MKARRSGALLCVFFVLSTFVVASPAHAGCASSGELAPVLQDVTLNQGLGSYPQLVRDKDILTRFFLRRPQCATSEQTVEVTSAALSVKVGGITVATIPAPENDLDPPPIVSMFSTAKSVGTTGDPVWIVDPEDLDLLGDGSAALQFEATIGYQSTLGSGTVNLTQLNGLPITKPVLPPTDPQRVLAIPIAPGVGQLTGAPLTETIKGFQHFGRMLPVANNTGDLTDTSVAHGGMQYFINTNTAYIPPSNFLSSGKFCGGNTKQQTQQINTDLNAFLQQHNGANPLTKSADRVLGIVVPTKPDGTAFACTSTLGSAQIHGTSAWVVAKTDLEMTAALMGLEGGHNLGGVPCGTELDKTKCPVDRDRDGDSFHSKNLAADGSDLDRAYNLFAPLSYLSDDRSVMRFNGQASGWLNANNLYELEDWALLLCRFGGPVTNDCTAPVESTLAFAAATDVTVLSGITDQTPQGTFVVDSFAEEPGGARTAPPSSPLHLLQRDAAGGVVSDIPVHVQDGHSAHLEEDDHGETEFLSFSVSYQSHPDATSFQLVNSTGEVLYERTEFGETTGIRDVQNTLEPLEVGPPCPVEECPDPRPMSGAGEFGTGATTIDFENGLETPAVTFIDDANSTPQTIRQCPGEPPSDGCLFPEDTDTQSPRHALWNRPQLVGGVNSPLDPLPNSAGDPLTMVFTQKQRKVGMWIGNDDVATDDTPEQTVTLTAFSDSDGKNEIPGAEATLSEEDFDNNVTTFIGVDAGINQIKRVELSYGDAILGEEIDDLKFERSTREPFVSNTWRLTTTARHDVPSLLRAAYFAKCTDTSGEEANRVLKAGVPADDTDEATDTATWRLEFDTRHICRDGERVTLRVKINDGYTQKGFFDIVVDVPAEPDTAPLAVIASPEGVSEVGDILSHENAFLFGQGWDQEDGQLPDSALTWYLDGPGISDPSIPVGTGQSVQVSPQGGHPCGWTPGIYAATLEVIDSDGNVTSASTTFEVLQDCDNDTMPAPEQCAGFSDSDNRDAVGDFDGDGVPNNQDEDPCVGLFLVTGDFEPNTLNVPSTGGNLSVAMSFQLSQRDLSEIKDKSKIRIVEVDGMDVTDPSVGGNQRRWFATAWSVSTTKGTKTGEAKFDRQALIDFIFHENGITNRYVTIVVEVVSSRDPIYKVHAQDQTFVQNG